MPRRCTDPTCPGSFEAGFCDTCGRAEPAAGAPAAAAATHTARQGGYVGATGRVTGARRPSAAGLTGGTAATSPGSTPSARTARSRGSSSRRRALGGGLVQMPVEPSLDPLRLLLPDARIPDGKAVCPACGNRVNPEKRFCSNCGAEYNFRPSLHAGDVLAGQYEVRGPIAFGGLGWIYLAMDTRLNRWVVLKGLLNAKDEAAAAAAVAERQFLAAVKHGKIVGIYTFVARDGESFIVMEYVGGRTLKAIRRERGPLPPAEAMAFVLGIIPAFAYLHEQGLVYCDFKPDNVMLEGDDVKLIDMGAVRRIGDPHGDIYGTLGYKAPEADQDPAIPSDLYTIGRTLAVLLLDFDNTGRYVAELPPPAAAPALAANESLYRFLLKATAADPDARFQSADEMAAQLTGVLRETVARESPVPAQDSATFLPERVVPGDPAALAGAWRRLPELRLDQADPAAAELFAALSAEPGARGPALAGAARAKPHSAEARLRAADLLIAAGDADPDAVLALLDAALALDPFDWRPDWYCGRLYLSLGRAAEAVECFDKVYAEIPGEPVPKLALAMALEADGRMAEAGGLYDTAGRSDPALAAAAFGLARARLAAADRAGAVAALARVPDSAALAGEARLSAIRILSAPDATEAELRQASDLLAALPRDDVPRHEAEAALALQAARQAEAGVLKPAGAKLLGVAAVPRALRQRAEAALRACARLSEGAAARVAFVDRANAARPRSLL